jgi:thiJ/pfpI family protein
MRNFEKFLKIPRALRRFREKKLVPFNLEQALKNRGAHYEKVFFPIGSKVVIDENLITGQNPFSSKAIARASDC